MNRIKFHVNEMVDYPIEKELFEEKTQKSPIFYRRSISSNEISQFAVCPACNGPAQIIGLYKTLGHTDYAYGKHVKCTISGLAEYYQENYDYCPYRAKISYHKESRKRDGNPLSLFIIRKLIIHFDRVIYFISKHTGIYISHSLAKKMLEDYFDSRAYLYPGSTLMNIPFMLMYFMRSSTLFYRKIRSDSTLLSSLSQLNEICLDKQQVKNATTDYHTLMFYFIKHRTNLKENRLTETLSFEVAFDERVIHKEVLTFNPDYSENIMRYDQNNLPEKARENNRLLINIAKNVAKEKGFIFDEMELSSLF